MIARYRTFKGAMRYSAEIRKKFPSVSAWAEQHPQDFGYGVKVALPNGKTAWADKRPKNYMRDPFHHRIASEQLEAQGE